MQTLLTVDNVGLVSSISEQGKANETQAQLGGLAPGPTSKSLGRTPTVSYTEMVDDEVRKRGAYRRSPLLNSH